MPQMKATKRRINFFSLPAELRNRIHRPLLTPVTEDEPRQTEMRVIFINTEDPVDEDDPRSLPDQPELTKTSRQVRQETLLIYYGANRFVTYTEYDGNVPALSDGYMLSHVAAIRWLRMIGSNNVRLLKHIRIRFLVLDNDLGQSRRLTNLYPATRFIAHAKSNGIDLPQGSVSGFNLDWIEKNEVDDTSIFRGATGCTIWREVNEVDLVYDHRLDIIWLADRTTRPIYVAGSWEECSAEHFMSDLYWC